MKKTYTKPEIMFESFSFSTSIAGSCEVIFSGSARGTCGIPDANGLGMMIFNVDAAGTNCVVPGTTEEKYDGLCYHIPLEGNNLFNS